VKILPVTLFKGLDPAFMKPFVTIKVVPKAASDSENCSENRPLLYTIEKFNQLNGRIVGTEF
jgi:hypothetical protein